MEFFEHGTSLIDRMKWLKRKNKEQWGQMQDERTKRLLKISRKSGLCGACALIEHNSQFSHHDYTGLRKSAQICRMCSIILDSLGRDIQGNPSSEVSVLSQNDILLYKFQNYPVSTFDIFTLRGTLYNLSIHLFSRILVI